MLGTRLQLNPNPNPHFLHVQTHTHTHTHTIFHCAVISGNFPCDHVWLGLFVQHGRMDTRPRGPDVEPASASARGVLRKTSVMEKNMHVRSKYATA